ncbi:hypothetical protein BVRB_2g028620 [Beta vulgaris subsp. vulgaris]|nr:hypothetical protein BVRB_2g028620 [Beta vulgaris subsp. vulgaris]
MMRDVMTTSKNNTTMIDGTIQRWNTPIPYLFGGLALMLCLIAIALLLLACSFRKSSSSNNGNNNGSRKMASCSTSGSENDTKIVVIMAGDENPTYLAKPLPCPMIIPFNTNHSLVERM